MNYQKMNAALDAQEKRKASAGCAPVSGSGSADPLVSELRSLATTEYPLCPEARLLLEMAVDTQLGKPIDLQRLLPNDPSSATPDTKTL